MSPLRFRVLSGVLLGLGVGMLIGAEFAARRWQRHYQRLQRHCARWLAAKQQVGPELLRVAGARN